MEKSKPKKGYSIYEESDEKEDTLWTLNGMTHTGYYLNYYHEALKVIRNNYKGVKTKITHE